MQYFIEISVASSFTPDVVLFDWFTIIGIYVKSENDTLPQIFFFELYLMRQWQTFEGAAVMI